MRERREEVRGGAQEREVREGGRKGTEWGVENCGGVKRSERKEGRRKEGGKEGSRSGK